MRLIWSCWASRAPSSSRRFRAVVFLSMSDWIWSAASFDSVIRWVLSLVSRALDLVVQPGEVGLDLVVLVLELGLGFLALGGGREGLLRIDDADLDGLLGVGPGGEAEDEDGDQRISVSSGLTSLYLLVVWYFRRVRESRLTQGLEGLRDAAEGGEEIGLLGPVAEPEVPVHLEMVAGDEEDALFPDELLDELGGIDRGGYSGRRRWPRPAAGENVKMPSWAFEPAPRGPGSSRSGCPASGRGPAPVLRGTGRSRPACR